MHRRHFLAGIPTIAALGILGPQGIQAPPAFAQGPPPALQTLKYEALGRLVRAQTGKVVLVDLWRHD